MQEGRIDFFIYADDLKLLEVIRFPIDQVALQRVLSDLYIWSPEMGMQLSPSRCQVLAIVPVAENLGV